MESPHRFLGLFLLLFFYRYVRLLVALWVSWKHKPIPPQRDQKAKPNDVTVVIPCLDCGAELNNTITSILATSPRKIILATIKINREMMRKMIGQIEHPETEIQVEAVHEPNKRKQMAAGIRQVKTKFTVFADDDVTWPCDLLRWILAPFEGNQDRGAVVTCQGLQFNDTQSWSQRVWRVLGARYLARRNFDCATTNYVDGGIPCTSGRTAAYLTRIVKDERFLAAFCNETWWGKELHPDDDNFLTRWMIEQGWSIHFQNDSRAMVLTTLEENPKYLLQCLRWARSNWRSNLRSLTEWQTWRRHPYSIYAVFLTTPLLPPALVTDGLLIWLCHRATENDRVLHSWSLMSLLAGIFVSKFIKFLRYYQRNPSDIVLMPVYVLFGYAHGIIKVYALFTLHVTAWESWKKDYPNQSPGSTPGTSSVKSASKEGSRGSWEDFVNAFQIYSPSFWPINTRQWFCIFGVGVCILVDRALNVVLPVHTRDVMSIVSRLDGLPLNKILLHASPYLFAKARVTSTVRQHLWQTLEDHWSYRIKITTYERIMALSADFHENQPSSDRLGLMSRLNDVQLLMTDVVLRIIPYLFDLVLSVHSVYRHFNVGLTSFYLVTVAIYVWYNHRCLSQKKGQYGRTLDSQMLESRYQYESISNWSTVASFNQFSSEQSRLAEAIKTSLESHSERILLYTHGNIVKDILLCATWILACLMAVQQSGRRDNLILITTWWTKLSNRLENLTSGIGAVNTFLVGLGPAVEVLRQRPTVSVRRDAPVLDVENGKVEFKGVTFSYGGGQLVLKDISCHMHGGGTTAIVGRTGSGKSTILRLLLRFFNPRKGSITIDNHDISDVVLGSLRDKMAFVSQNFEFFTSSIRESVRYGKADADEEDIHKACEAAGIHDDIMKFDDQYNSPIQRLSGGQKQRVAIARALIRDTNLLILDEPTNQLDKPTATRVQRNISEYTKGRTIIVVTHQLSFAKDAQHIIVMSDGEVVGQGTHDSLLEGNSHYREMWNNTLIDPERKAEGHE